ncbi:SDR family NAD(P)-dependent oxidoreductase [Serratia microhaemolytica]|uniref:SDR family NAD(P)-dependent oxidoreductase n=1 Tax=Serratia microhaemolytica TaxID=2675110 RepID=UPI001F0C80B1|nr:SDR family NAD(P)-dependent oxidoreductase [Serratia microhaemolytica]
MIIGGTSGIGLALGRYYVGAGAEVALCGRDPARLVSDPLLSHQRVQLYRVDISERMMLSQVMTQFTSQRTGGLDLLIVTAGHYIDAEQAQENERVDALLATNIRGLCNAFDLALTFGARQLVAVASIAGLLPDYPGLSLYAASKRATIAICDAYRIGLSPRGVAVTTLVPGYIDTQRLRELNFGSAAHKPFLQHEDRAVQLMVAAIQRKSPRYIFPWQLHLMVKIFSLLPRWLQRLRQR